MIEDKPSGRRYDWNDFAERARRGESLDEIASATGAAASTVRTALIKMKVPRSSQGKPPPGRIPRQRQLDYDEIVRRYLAGESAPEIAKALGTVRNAIYRVLRLTKHRVPKRLPKGITDEMRERLIAIYKENPDFTIEDCLDEASTEQEEKFDGPR